MSDWKPQQLRAHDVCLQDGPLRLRPMTEEDWPPLVKWNSDPEVLFYALGESVYSRCPDEVQAFYRGVSWVGFNFIIELEGRPIGEARLRKLDVERLLRQYPGEMDLRRVDIVIGEKELWGRGWGKRAIALLTNFGLQQGADAVFVCDVADNNPRSRRAFEANGYLIDLVTPLPPGAKAREKYDLVFVRPFDMEKIAAPQGV